MFRSLNRSFAPASRRLLASTLWKKHAVIAPQGNKLFSTLLNSAKMGASEDQRRSISTSVPLTAAITLKEEEKEPELQTFKDVVSKYGMYPLAGLLTVAAISKEVYFLGPETLLLGNFCLTFFAGYVLAAEAANAHFDKERKQYNAVVDDMLELQSAMWESRIEICQSRLKFADYLEHVKTKEVESMRALSKAASLTARHQAQTAMLKKLRSIQDEESEAERARVAALSNDAADTVEQQFLASDPKVKNAMIENAIASFVDEKPPHEDPVKKLFEDFLKARAPKA